MPQVVSSQSTAVTDGSGAFSGTVYSEYQCEVPE